MLMIRPKPILAVRPTVTVQTPASDTITLCASPFIDSEDLWLDALSVFHSWLHKRFKGRASFGDYEVARALDVHRCITDHWLASLVRAGYAKSIIVGHRGGFEAHATTLLHKPALKNPRIEVPEDLETFDPWTDRSLDDEIPDALYPDLYIDKFYEVLNNETVLVERKTRIRPCGHYHEPVIVTEHPRYARSLESVAAALADGTPPPLAWRDRIDELARGEKTMRRNR